MTISCIVACNRLRGIGLDNNIPWHQPKDLKHFRAYTMNKPVVMGRKTYESIGTTLDGRDTIILSKGSGGTYSSLEELLEAYKDVEELMVIGGESVYKQFLDKDIVDKVYMTVIDNDMTCDRYFPELSKDRWLLVEKKKEEKDNKNTYDMTFKTYHRIKQ